VASKEEYEHEAGGGRDGIAQGALSTSHRGVAALVSLLEKHAGLTEVDLFSMDLGDWGALALAKV